jgi:hypothetical protein
MNGDEHAMHTDELARVLYADPPWRFITRSVKG